MADAKVCPCGDGHVIHARSDSTEATCLRIALARERTAHEETRRELEAQVVNEAASAEELRERLGKTDLEMVQARTDRYAALDRVREVETALQDIADWKLPPSGCSWEDGKPMSYGAAWGSNGERDHMRKLARAALGPQKPAVAVVDADAALDAAAARVYAQFGTDLAAFFRYVQARAAGLLPEAAPQDKEEP